MQRRMVAVCRLRQTFLGETKLLLAQPHAATMLHAWRHASTAVAAQRAAASVAAHLPTGALLLAAPLPLLLPPSRGFASKSPIGRSGIARAENPWGTNKSSGNRAANAAPSQQQAQTTTQPPPPRQERNSSSDFGARNAWSSRSRDGGSNSAASGSGSSGGKKRYHPRTLGAAAAAANPRPAAARSSVTNPSGPAWAPVAAKFAEASAWTPAPQKAWSRGGGAKHSSQTAAPQTGAGAQSWARSAARRERSHGAPLPDLSAGPAPAQAQAPPAAGSHKRGSRPTAEGRSSYRHGGERDARSKMRERERYTPPTAPSAAFDPSSSADVSRVPRSPRSFPETADLEEDVMEDVEATKSAAEFWTHFPSVNNSATKKGAAAGTKPGEAPQVPQRLVPLPPEPEQYKPVFLNHPPPSSNASPGATSSAAAAPSRRAVPAPAAAKVRGSELSELMGTSVGSVSLNRSTLRLGVLLPDPAPQDLGFVDPEAPPPSEADRALEAFHDRVRQRIEGLCQQLATDTGADLTTHPLHVDMCAEFVPMDLADVTGGAAAALAAAPSSVSASSSSLPPDPLLVLQLFESSIRHAPNSHRGHLRIRADASTGQGSGVRGTALKGQGFFPSFVDYFKHAAARVHRDANEAKLMARSAMIRAVGWKPTQENAAVATEEPEEEEGEETEADAEHAEPVTESSEQSDATASSTTATPAASKPAAAAATTSKPPSRRLRLRNVSAQLPQPLAGLTVMDATAGFGVDAFALAMVSLLARPV